jgi:hypothetical protein
MYIKIKDSQIEQYPYSIAKLKQENKNVSFPENPSDEILAQFGVYKVNQTAHPTFTYKQIISESEPQLVDGSWNQVWTVNDRTNDNINMLHEELRAEAYRNESDPLFFKAQRGEIDMQVWVDKVAEIKSRYPNV